MVFKSDPLRGEALALWSEFHDGTPPANLSADELLVRIISQLPELTYSRLMTGDSAGLVFPRASSSLANGASAPLSVVVRGEDVVVLGAGGAQVMSIRAARISARRLLDAIDVATGRVPSS